MKLPSAPRLPSSIVILLILYPWMVGFDADSNHTEVTIGGGGMRFLQAPASCATGRETYVYSDFGSFKQAHVGAFDAGLELRRMHRAFDYGVRGGIFHTPDYGALFDSTEFKPQNDGFIGSDRTAQIYTMWYANPFFQIHSVAGKGGFNPHAGIGVLITGVPHLFTNAAFGFEVGCHEDSMVFLDFNANSDTPLISGSGLVSFRCGYNLGDVLNNTIVWGGIAGGSPFSQMMYLGRLSIPLGNVRWNVNALIGTSEYSLGSTVTLRF